MYNKSIKTLELDKILNKLSGYAVSDNAKEHAKNLIPSNDIETVKKKLLETTEMVKIIVNKGPIPFKAIYPIDEYLEMAKIQMILKMPDLLRICHNLTEANMAKNYIENYEEDLKSLKYFTSMITPLSNIIKEINRCIISENEMADDASEKLFSIRGRKKILKLRIRQKLEKIVSSPSYSKLLQDAIITTRDGRFVVPVKSEYKQNFEGIVHDMSSSGATLFIEPMSVVNMNNEISELNSEEEKEIEKILYDLTILIMENKDDISNNIKMLHYLDFINAKGILSYNINAIEPKINDQKVIYLRNARHPLLDREKAVPLNLMMGKEFTSLIITGPNTGGKTVALKTVGLLSLMIKMGLHIPAEYGSSLYIFDNIYADIGDEQSISQNLSTFSSHMTNIVNILESATENSLAIFDELGAGTDPLEGAGLAKAILDYLKEKNIMTLSSTHYSELKNYAMIEEKVENASMEFDVETLSPTYKLTVGIPGKSNAFEISRKLGLDEKIIKNAKFYMNKEDIHIEDLIKKLQEERNIYERKNEEISRLEEENLLENARLKNLVSQMRKNKEKRVEEAKYKARQIVKQAKYQTEALINEINELKRKSNISDRDIQNLRDKERGLENKYVNNNKVSLKVAENKKIKNVKIGDTVFVPSFNQNAKVINIDRNDIIVQMGNMTINLKKKNLAMPIKEEKASTTGTSSVKIRDKKISPNIDLRGMTLDEALNELDKYIDDALLSGLSEFTIIHGMGTYVLKNGIREYLRKHSHVKKYEDDLPSLGGATNVILK